jgi:hypothetical protein
MECRLPLALEVEMGGGPTILSVSPDAAAVLRGELDLYLQKYGFR